MAIATILPSSAEIGADFGNRLGLSKSGDCVDLSTNPFAILSFISAPAVLTNASCVLLFGTGNRYGRAVDRVHELSDAVESSHTMGEIELRLRVRQLESSEKRVLLIVQALSCFYTAVAGFVASTLVSLIGALLVSAGMARGVRLSFGLAFLAGSIGVSAVLTGAVMLARESQFSLRILREEREFITSRAHQRVANIAGAADINT
jgi:hypothetical protein